MRGIAALAVVLYHVPGLHAALPVGSAYVAVDLFFLLSGFVISHAYGRKIGERWSLKEFMLVRFIRLWPLHILGLTIAAAVALVPLISGRPPVIGWQSYLASLPAVIFLPTFPFAPNTPLFPLNIPVWSLLFELIVNLLAAVIWRRLGNRLLGTIIVVSALALVAIDLTRGNLDQGTKWGTFDGGLARVMFSFFAGVALYRIRDKLERVNIHPLIIAAAMIALFAPTLEGAARTAYGIFSVLIACPLLVAAGTSSKPWAGAAPAFLLAGHVSYALYVLHSPAWDLAGAMVGFFHHRDWLPSVWFGALFLVPTLLGAWLAARFYDPPVRRFLTGLRKG